MSMFETVRPITMRTTIGLLPSGQRIRARSFPAGALLDREDDAETRALVSAGLLRPAPDLPSVTAAELERGRTAVNMAERVTAKEQAALLEAQRQARDVESRSDDRAALEKVWTDVRYAEHRVRRARDAESSARSALAELERRASMTEGRRELAAELERRAKQDEAIGEICTAVADLKKQIDRAVALGPDAIESRQRIVDAVTSKCQAVGIRPAEIGWVFS
jgi:hypothetical protein